MAQTGDYHTSDGLPVVIDYDEENGAYFAYAEAYMEKCYVPSGRGFTIEAAITALEVALVSAPAEWALCEDAEYMAKWNAEWDEVMSAVKSGFFPQSVV